MMKKITKIVNILCMNILQSYNFFLSKTSTISQSFHLSICLLDFYSPCFCLCFYPVLVEYSISHKFSVSPILELFVKNDHWYPCFRNFDSVIPVNVIRVKPSVDNILDSSSSNQLKRHDLHLT